MTIRQVACPASPLGGLHKCAYHIDRGIWKCYSCGIGGTTAGFAHLNDLEAERHRLAIELEHLTFELELATGGTR